MLTLRRPHLPGANALDKAARAPAGRVKLSAAVTVSRFTAGAPARAALTRAARATLSAATNAGLPRRSTAPAPVWGARAIAASMTPSAATGAGIRTVAVEGAVEAEEVEMEERDETTEVVDAVMGHTRQEAGVEAVVGLEVEAAVGVARHAKGVKAGLAVADLEVQAAMVVEAEEDEDVAVGVPDEVHTTLFPRASKFRVASLRCP